MQIQQSLKVQKNQRIKPFKLQALLRQTISSISFKCAMVVFFLLILNALSYYTSSGMSVYLATSSIIIVLLLPFIAADQYVKKRISKKS